MQFVATLQRALKARGEFNAPITGAWDSATLQALRKFQRARGLDSAQISLQVARESRAAGSSLNIGVAAPVPGDYLMLTALRAASTT